jgi:Ni,Fe-hydrogenase III large subunit
VPGGVFGNTQERALAALAACAARIAEEAVVIRGIYDEHAGVRDRFTGAGSVTPELAAQLGLCGLAGRASAQAHDLRADLPSAPYTELSVRKFVSRDGDVAARVALRFDELQESARLVAAIVRGLPNGAFRSVFALPAAAGMGSAHLVRRPHSALSPARSFVAELAGPRTRDHRQHRAGFPAHQ